MGVVVSDSLQGAMFAGINRMFVACWIAASRRGSHKWCHLLCFVKGAIHAKSMPQRMYVP